MRIDNAPLREAFLACGRPLAQIAADIGKDPEALRRSLGLAPYRRKDRHGSDKRYKASQTRMAASTAALLLEPLGLWPQDVGL